MTSLVRYDGIVLCFGLCLQSLFFFVVTVKNPAENWSNLNCEPVKRVFS